MTPKLSVITGNIRRRMNDLNIRYYTELEKKAGVGKDTIRNLMSGKTKGIRTEKLKPIAIALGLSLEEFLSAKAPQLNADGDEYMVVPRYDVKLSAGAGAFPTDDEPIDYVPFNRQWLRRSISSNLDNLAVVEVSGDSMEPAIRSGDEVLINLSDTSLVDGGVFAILAGDMLVIKRVFPSLDGVEIRSDNPARPSWTVKGDSLNDLKVIGRAVVRVGKLN